MEDQIKSEHTGDAVAPDSEEGRSKQRNVTGSRKQALIRKSPNEATLLVQTSNLIVRGEVGEVKHLSSRI